MRIILANSLWSRITGMLLSKCCSDGETLLLTPCSSIHSFGMRSTLDIAFIDAEGRVLYSERALPPARLRVNRRAVAKKNLSII